MEAKKKRATKSFNLMNGMRKLNDTVLVIKKTTRGIGIDRTESAN